MSVSQIDLQPKTVQSSRIERFIQTWRAKIFLFLGMRRAAKAVFLELLVRSPDNVLALNSLAYDSLQSLHPAVALD